MNELSVVRFIEDIRRLSKIAPHVRKQMLELDLDVAGLTAGADGYADESPYMLYMIGPDDTLYGKLEYAFSIDHKFAQIIWIIAPNNGSDLLAEFEARMMELMPRCTISLICSLDSGECDDMVLRRLNFYIKHNYKATKIEYKTASCTHLTLSKTLETNKDRL